MYALGCRPRGALDHLRQRLGQLGAQRAELLAAAQHYVHVEYFEFADDTTCGRVVDALLLALTSAAQRGVDVTLIVSEIGDQFLVYHAQRSYYEELLKAGVRIY